MCGLGACLSLLALGACDKRTGTAKHIPRDDDALPVVVVDEVASATATIDEVEPNNERAQATEVALGEAGKGVLDGEEDVDFYRVAVASADVLSVRLSGIEAVDLMLELQDQGGEVLARSDRGPAGTLEGIANFYVEPGSYFLAVREFVPKRRKRKGEPRTGPSPAYTLELARLSEIAETQEREPNQDVEGARELLVGDEGSGFIGWGGDVDLWKLPVEGFTEQYSLDLDLTGVPAATLTLELLDSGGSVILKRTGAADSALAVRNLVPESAGDDATGPTQHTYYARISARRSNPVDPYLLRVSSHLLDLSDEREPNDVAAQASSLLGVDPGQTADSRSGRVTGTLTVGDTDVFSLPAQGEAVALTVELVPREDLDATLTVLSNGETRAMANANGKGGKEYLADVRIDAGASAVVQISGEGALGEGAGYLLNWSLATAFEPPQDTLDSTWGELPPELGGDAAGSGDDFRGD
ncbi:peptidase domain protein [Haliangium ochraceum DSM 14365]|uniref:Peptidase domain protein n=1 Tax=Haliangium ochraceum (strain DSM 14365 / JCM 11303 / SMP-2) TaxID=502025 RepID=D0LI89_HALO1|nr:peptidase domain protein [Haliangium ochraceum DSM 14365]